MNVTVSYQVKGIEREHQLAVSSLMHPQVQVKNLQPASVHEVAQYIISYGLLATNLDIAAFCVTNGLGEVHALQLGWGNL